jgi:hypothetical protein
MTLEAIPFKTPNHSAQKSPARTLSTVSNPTDPVNTPTKLHLASANVTYGHLRKFFPGPVKHIESHQRHLPRPANRAIPTNSDQL